MAETFLLTLEVDDQGSIKVQNFKKQVEDAGTGTEKAGKQAAEAGHGGFNIFGLAVAKSTEEVGLNFRASHMLGTRVEEIARRTFPAWGMAFNAVGVAALVGLGFINQYREAAQRKREETERNIKALEDEVRALYSNKLETYEVQKAHEALALAKRRIWQDEVSDKINQESLALQNLEKEYKDLTTDMSGYYDAMRDFGYETENQDKSEIESKKRAVQQKIDVAKKEMNEQIEILRASWSSRLKTDEYYQNYAAIAWAEFQDGVQKKRLEQGARDRQLDIEYEKAYLDLKKELGITSMADQLAAEKIVFDKEMDDRIQKMERDKYTTAQIEQYKATQGIMWATHEAAEKKKILQQQMDTTISTFDHLSAAAKLYYEEGHKGSRKAFTAYKLFEEARIVASTASAAMSAIDQGGPYLGWALAAAIVAEGAMQLNKVRKLTPDGGGGDVGISGGSVGTYSGNYGTGLPDLGRNVNKGGDIYLSIDGGRSYSKIDLARDVTQTLYDHNGDVGNGLKVQVERSA